MNTGSEADVPGISIGDAIKLGLLRLAAGGLAPARWFTPAPPVEQDRAARTGRLSLEIVTHCWGYSPLLAYQLSSLVLYPPTCLDVTMTVFHAAEDGDTVDLLEYFRAQQVRGVSWNWQVLDKGRLFRRSIGRNLAARATDADWLWFTDCDVVFHAGCLDALSKALQGRRNALVFPREENCSFLLEPTDRMLRAAAGKPCIVDIDTARFTPEPVNRATGPLQIAHGDVARACGYCDSLDVYQKPSRKWAKAHEDRAFRWSLRTQGTPVDVPGVYRILHASKGRYQGNRLSNALRLLNRRMRDRRARLRGAAGAQK